MNTIYEVIRKPIVSEKTERSGQYVFQVALQANKQEIRDAVRRLFHVDVQNVRTAIMHGKVKRAGRAVVARSNWKKAWITLASGQKIEFNRQGA